MYKHHLADCDRQLKFDEDMHVLDQTLLSRINFRLLGLTDRSMMYHHVSWLIRHAHV